MNKQSASVQKPVSVPYRMMRLLRQVNRLGPVMKILSDEELAGQTEKLRLEYQRHRSLDKLLPEAFATVREAAYRTIGLYPYDVQILGGIALYEGHIAEMKTGEGKTLVAALPAYLMSLAGRGVHVVTVNDYLANRDAMDIGRIHRFLGVSVGVVLQGMDPLSRKQAYACDITYVTNNELGFDYLRDNMVMNKKGRVQRGLFYAIVDEVDSVLIDEARTPLIISGMKGTALEFYRQCDDLVQKLERGTSSGEISKLDALSGNRAEETGDYVVNEKERSVHLTDRGVRKVEQVLNLKNYADPEHLVLRHHVQMALQAHTLYERDRDYVVKDGAVVLVDSFTGRIMEGRRFSDGLHQALEAKEHVDVQRETQTMATITFQNFFNKYEKKAGMTGTAITSAEEFKSIYGLSVVRIPTNKPVQRVDEEDAVYLTKTAKRAAVIAAVHEAYGRRQPVLVGTTTIHESELLSKLLSDVGIPHQVLNAKHHAREAEIISHAGEAGTVTIATNMAGRGTDIKLTDEAREAGGLFVIGTERHEARRIDDQLRGRSGRQGDPGRSKFFLSLDDDVMRIFGSDTMIRMLRSLGADENVPIQHPALSKLVTDAQKKIEDNNFGLRKALMDFDTINNEQRELLYGQRNVILNGADPEEKMHHMVQDVAAFLVDKYFAGAPKDWDMHGFLQEWNQVFPETVRLSADRKVMKRQALREAERMYQAHLKLFPQAAVAGTQRRVLLRCVDWDWVQHLEYLVRLQQAVGVAGYGQRDPVVVYRDKAYTGFGRMLWDIQYITVKLFFRTKPSVQVVQKTISVGDIQVKQESPAKPVEPEAPSDPVPPAKPAPIVTVERANT